MSADPFMSAEPDFRAHLEARRAHLVCFVPRGYELQEREHTIFDQLRNHVEYVVAKQTTPSNTVTVLSSSQLNQR